MFFFYFFFKIDVTHKPRQLIVWLHIHAALVDICLRNLVTQAGAIAPETMFMSLGNCPKLRREGGNRPLPLSVELHETPSCGAGQLSLVPGIICSETIVQPQAGKDGSGIRLVAPAKCPKFIFLLKKFI